MLKLKYIQHFINIVIIVIIVNIVIIFWKCAYFMFIFYNTNVIFGVPQNDSRPKSSHDYNRILLQLFCFKWELDKSKTVCKVNHCYDVRTILITPASKPRTTTEPLQEWWRWRGAAWYQGTWSEASAAAWRRASISHLAIYGRISSTFFTRFYLLIKLVSGSILTNEQFE